MINFIWAAMILISVISGALNGRLSEVAQGAFDGANGAVQTVIGFIGVTALWNGLMQIAKKSGLVEAITKIIRPIILVIFPDLKKEKSATEAVSANMVANMLGLANAATPLGIKAMGELDRINGYKKTASDAMCMFAVINSASIQLIPTTMIGIRASMGSSAPTEIIVPVWIVSFAAALCGICMAKFMSRISYVRGEERKWVR